MPQAIVSQVWKPAPEHAEVRRLATPLTKGDSYIVKHLFVCTYRNCPLHNASGRSSRRMALSSLEGPSKHLRLLSLDQREFGRTSTFQINNLDNKRSKFKTIPQLGQAAQPKGNESTHGDDALLLQGLAD